jgi:4-hydroxy-3-polyprenylbenzoate decarboxylase
MGYESLQACVSDLERNGHLIRIKEEVDPFLEMAAIHLRVYESNGPALLFENVKGCNYRCASNLFGSLERSRYMFRDTLETVGKLVRLKGDPTSILKNPSWLFDAALGGIHALPRKGFMRFQDVKIGDLPQVQCWPDDGGPFVTLPQVYTEDIDRTGLLGSNLGMYRIQIGGNEYVKDREIGLHYQLHRGIGVHQTKSNALGLPLKVAVFVGGPPSHTFAAVMPLPEGIPEVSFAGALGGRRFRYAKWNGFTISTDADFVILGEVYPMENKPEGPFGDHLGYYSLKHDFPLMRVTRVLAKQNGIWPFTVVGRPPQEDTSFGALIHEITGPIIPQTIPGLKEVHAVDAAGVHPLLLAIGSERYTPYSHNRRPQEILTIANAILGFNQMSLAKFLFIAARQDSEELNTHDTVEFFQHILERLDTRRDLHFHTNTTMDTLDYSGDGLNTGSKVVVAAAGPPIRNLGDSLPSLLFLPGEYTGLRMVMPGVLALHGPSYHNDKNLKSLEDALMSQLDLLSQWPLIVVCDDAEFVAHTLNNFLWVTFTRCNPSHDIHGVDEFVLNKHWGCNGPILLDARTKPHHAPPLIKDSRIEAKVDALGARGRSLHGVI